jgi:hypothetical protein
MLPRLAGQRHPRSPFKKDPLDTVISVELAGP